MFRSNIVHDVGTLRQRIEFSGSFHSVANNTGKADRNYELFVNLCCQGYQYFGSREKYFIVSYGMIIH